MKNFRVAVCYEEGFVVDVQASSEKEAEQKVLNMVDENSNALESKVVHRSYFINDIELKKESQND